MCDTRSSVEYSVASIRLFRFVLNVPIHTYQCNRDNRVSLWFWWNLENVSYKTRNLFVKDRTLSWPTVHARYEGRKKNRKYRWLEGRTTRVHRFFSFRVRNEGNTKRTATARDTRRWGREVNRDRRWKVEGGRFVSVVGDGCGRSWEQNGRSSVALATESGGTRTFPRGGAFKSWRPLLIPTPIGIAAWRMNREPTNLVFPALLADIAMTVYSIKSRACGDLSWPVPEDFCFIAPSDNEVSNLYVSFVLLRTALLL